VLDTVVTYYLSPLDQSPYYYAIPLIIAICSVFLYELRSNRNYYKNNVF